MEPPTDRPLSYYAKFLSLPGNVPPGGCERSPSPPRAASPPSSPAENHSDSEDSSSSEHTDTPHEMALITRRVNNTPLPPDHRLDPFATRTKLRYSFSWDCLKTMCLDRGLTPGSKDMCIERLLEWHAKLPPPPKEEPKPEPEPEPEPESPQKMETEKHGITNRFAPAEEIPDPDDLLEVAKTLLMSQYTRPQLQQMCCDRDLASRGSKGDLAHALYQWRQRTKIRASRDAKRELKAKRRLVSKKTAHDKKAQSASPSSSPSRSPSSAARTSRTRQKVLSSSPAPPAPPKPKTPKTSKKQDKALAKDIKKTEVLYKQLDGLGPARLEKEFNKEELVQMCLQRDLPGRGSKKVMASSLYVWKQNEKRKRGDE